MVAQSTVCVGPSITLPSWGPDSHARVRQRALPLLFRGCAGAGAQNGNGGGIGRRRDADSLGERGLLEVVELLLGLVQRPVLLEQGLPEVPDLLVIRLPHVEHRVERVLQAALQNALHVEGATRYHC